MTNKNKYTLYLILLFSLFFNTLVITFDTIPYVLPKIQKIYFPTETIKITSDIDYAVVESLIVNSSLKMLNNKTSLTSWNEPKGFTQEVLRVARNQSNTEYSLNNYPQAFLYYGLTEYLINKKDFSALNKVRIKFDEYIDFTQDIKRIDQAPNGLTALAFYNIYKDKKYLDYSENLFKYILEQVEEDNLISYRKGQKAVFPDTLGLVVPFLLEYNKYTEIDTYSLAYKQMAYFINFGVNKQTYIPAHALNRHNNIPLGSINWGRGIGWYTMALAHFHKEKGEFKEEYYGLLETLETLETLKNAEDLWGQFPGSNDKFDASSSLLFQYSIELNSLNKKSIPNVINMFKSYISSKGVVLETSGDTYGINRYSSTFGKSELSQGLLLLILSKADINKVLEAK